MELLTEHGSSQKDPSRDIQQYRCLSVSAVDPLEWWRTQTETYRRLSIWIAQFLQQARLRNAFFSAAGVVMLNCKQSSLLVHVIDRVIFVHQNGHVLEDV